MTPQPVMRGVEVDLGDGLIHQGFADSAGRFVLPFSYPALPTGAGGSPSAPPSFADAEWPYQLRVYFDPGLLDRLPGTDLPDHLGMLEQFLGQSSEVFAVAPTDGGVAMESLPGVFRRGQDAVARTAGLSTLVITPVTGSP